MPTRAELQPWRTSQLPKQETGLLSIANSTSSKYQRPEGEIERILPSVKHVCTYACNSQQLFFLLRLFVRSPGPKKQPLCKPLLPLQTAPHVRSNPATKSRSALCAPGLRGSFIPFSRHPVCQQGLVDDRRHFYFTLLSTTAEQTTLFFSGQYLVVTLHLKLTSTAEKYIQKKGTLNP